MTVTAFVHYIPPKRSTQHVVPALEELCPQLELRLDGEWSPGKNDVGLVLGNARWYPALTASAEASRKAGAHPRMAIWQWEPLPPSKASGLPQPSLSPDELDRIRRDAPQTNDVYRNFAGLRRLVDAAGPCLVAASTVHRVEFLSEEGIPAHHVPLGYTPEDGRDLRLARDIDVLFLGDPMTAHRQSQLAKLKGAGIDVNVCGGWDDPAYWGENRTRLLNRVKIFLVIPRHAGEFGGWRMAIGMANKTLVLSEPLYRPDPFVAGKHFVSVPAEQMPAAIRYYLAHEDERLRIAEESHRFVREEVSLRDSVSRLISLMERHFGDGGRP